MEKWLTLLNDMGVIIFDLLLYVQMTVLRKNEARHRRILYAGCVVIVAFYFVAVNLLAWPAAVAAFVCMTLPSLALFWALSQYRDARFFLTFCFVDTVSLIIGFIARYIGILLGSVGSILAGVGMLPCFILLYVRGRPYFKRYREALSYIDRGWKRLTLSAGFIYIVLIFTAAYPKPLVERPEYCLPYLAVSVMVLFFYVVFFTNIAVTKKAYEQSERLKEQQGWYKMAYVDALTGIPNRIAYMERIHEIELMEDQTAPVAIVVMDLDHFKSINDARGHSVGDEVLRQAADYLSDSFAGENSTVYRIGGDEFAAIMVGVEETELTERLSACGSFSDGAVTYGISSGYALVDRSEKNAVEQAFERADAMMYVHKAHKPVRQD